METIIINNQHYKMPESIVEINNNAVDFYGVMNLSEVFTGLDDFDRIENEGGDWFDSQCFEAYGEHYGVNGDEVEINKVADSMFAWFSDYKGENPLS